MQNFLLFIALSIGTALTCSDVFRYMYEGNQIVGQVVLVNPSFTSHIHLEVKLSVPAKIQSTFYGEIKLENERISYESIKQGQPILYRVYFPVQQPLPQPFMIAYNGITLCSISPVSAAYVTTLKLYHDFSFSNIPNTPAISSNYYPISTSLPAQYHQTLPPRPQPQPTQTQSPVNVNINVRLNVECGTRNAARTQAISLIVNGENSTKGEFPWLVAFYYRSRGFICGASLVSTRLVVTAAHCVQNKFDAIQRNPHDAIFYFGKYELESLSEVGYQSSPADAFYVSNSWNPNVERYDGDIAVALLTNVIDYSQYIQPICMWPQVHSHADLAGQIGVAAGWGVTENGSLSRNIRSVQIPIVSDEECLRSNEHFSSLTSESTICAGDLNGKGHNSCSGDSGGGLAVMGSNNKYYLRGVISASLRTLDGNCDVRNYVLYTDAARFSNWINSYIKQYG